VQARQDRREQRRLDQAAALEAARQQAALAAAAAEAEKGGDDAEIEAAAAAAAAAVRAPPLTCVATVSAQLVFSTGWQAIRRLSSCASVGKEEPTLAALYPSVALMHSDVGGGLGGGGGGRCKHRRRIRMSRDQRRRRTTPCTSNVQHNFLTSLRRCGARMGRRRCCRGSA
jgi:hypothetical protein